MANRNTPGDGDPEAVIQLMIARWFPSLKSIETSDWVAYSAICRITRGGREDTPDPELLIRQWCNRGLLQQPPADAQFVWKVFEDRGRTVFYQNPTVGPYTPPPEAEPAPVVYYRAAPPPPVEPPRPSYPDYASVPPLY